MYCFYTPAHTAHTRTKQGFTFLQFQIRDGIWLEFLAGCALLKKSQDRTTLLNIQVSTNTSSTIYSILGISPSSFSHLTFKHICVPKKRISINLLLNNIKWVFFFPITRECPLLQPCKMTFCPSRRAPKHSDSKCPSGLCWPKGFLCLAKVPHQNTLEPLYAQQIG